MQSRQKTVIIVIAINNREEVKIMGETDILFKAFIRFVLDALKEVKEEDDKEKREVKMNKILENLQKTLED